MKNICKTADAMFESVKREYSTPCIRVVVLSAEDLMYGVGGSDYTGGDNEDNSAKSSVGDDWFE